MNEDVVLDIEGPVARPGRSLGTRAKLVGIGVGLVTFVAGVYVAVKVGGRYGVLPAALAQVGVTTVGVGLTYGALYAFAEDDPDVTPDETGLPTFSRYVGAAADRYLGVL